MNNRTHLGILVSSLLVFFGSSGAFAQGTSCTYELNPSSVAVSWTAFKTTQKVGVNGSFTQINVKGKMQAQSLAQLMDGLQVSVDDLSVNTGNPARDKNITDFFFKKLKPAISGKVKNFSDKGKFVLALSFNGKTRDVPMLYVEGKDQSFVATGRMDILDFGGKAALGSIHQKCLDLHKGPDGVSKTWPDVVLNLKGVITKSCK